MTEIPEPPDGSRIEFTFESDVYAAWRDDASSVETGWVDTPGDGGATWCVYPDSCPRSWASMIQLFGEALRDAVHLIPLAEDVAPASCGCPIRREAVKVLRHTPECSDLADLGDDQPPESSLPGLRRTRQIIATLRRGQDSR